MATLCKIGAFDFLMTKKILIVKLSSIGDVMVSSSIPIAVKKNNNMIIHHMVMEHCAFVTQNNPGIDKQVVLSFLPSGSYIKDALNLYRISRQIIREKYDYVFIFHRNIVFQLLSFIWRIPKRYGFSSFINCFYTKHLYYKFDINRTLQECSLIKLSDIVFEDPKELFFNCSSSASNKSLDVCLPSNYYVCNPGGGNLHAPADNRLWPIENFAHLINRVSIPFVILGAGENDSHRVSILKKLLDPGLIIDLVDQTSFDQSALIIRQSIAYIGNDSSLMFLATSMGTPALGLYGPTQSSAAKPLGVTSYAILADTPCSPCYDPYDGLRGKMYKCQNNICMQSISPNRVYSELMRISKKSL